MPVWAYAPTRTIAQILGTGHWTGHPGAVQDALSAHLAVKNGSLAELFELDKEPLAW